MRGARKTVAAWSAEGLQPVFAHAMRNMRPKYTGPNADQRDANELAEHLMSLFAGEPADVRARLCRAEAKRLDRTAEADDALSASRRRQLCLAAKVLRVTAEHEEQQSALPAMPWEVHAFGDRYRVHNDAVDENGFAPIAETKNAAVARLVRVAPVLLIALRAAHVLILDDREALFWAEVNWSTGFIDDPMQAELVAQYDQAIEMIDDVLARAAGSAA